MQALDARERALSQREQAVAAAEALLVEREHRVEAERRALQERNGAEPDTGEDGLHAERRERSLELADAAAATTATMGPSSAPTPEQDVDRLAQIEARLTELRDAEKLFLRTRDELADRSEAVAARERLVAQKERELDDREDGVGRWASPELDEMEARLRRLEQGQGGSEQTLGFSGGLRKLQDGTTRAQRDA
jgi:hypothetical protein